MKAQAQHNMHWNEKGKITNTQCYLKFGTKDSNLKPYF
jgi:hypothetical protein